MTIKTRTWATTVAAAFSLLLSSGAAASTSCESTSDVAASSGTDESLTIELGDDTDSATGAVLTVDVTGLDEAEIAQTEQFLHETLGDDPAVAVVPERGDMSSMLTTQAALTPTGIPCNKDKFYTDANNTLNIQNNCSFGRVNWGITLSSGLRGIINSPVNELGARGYRNGVFISKNAPHLGVSKTYWFHGGFKISSVPSKFRITDNFEFTVRVGGRTLPGSLYVDKLTTLVR